MRVPCRFLRQPIAEHYHQSAAGELRPLEQVGAAARISEIVTS
jgi:hypothetical protein